MYITYDPETIKKMFEQLPTITESPKLPTSRTIKFKAVTGTSCSLEGIGIHDGNSYIPIAYFTRRQGTFCDLIRKIYKDFQGKPWIEFVNALQDKVLIEVRVYRKAESECVYDII